MNNEFYKSADDCFFYCTYYDDKIDVAKGYYIGLCPSNSFTYDFYYKEELGFSKKAFLKVSDIETKAVLYNLIGRIQTSIEKSNIMKQHVLKILSNVSNGLFSGGSIFNND